MAIVGTPKMKEVYPPILHPSIDKKCHVQVVKFAFNSADAFLLSLPDSELEIVHRVDDKETVLSSIMIPSLSERAEALKSAVNLLTKIHTEGIPLSVHAAGDFNVVMATTLTKAVCTASPHSVSLNVGRRTGREPLLTIEQDDRYLIVSLETYDDTVHRVTLEMGMNPCLVVQTMTQSDDE